MKRLTLRISDEAAAKLAKLARKAKRTLSAQLEYLVDFSTELTPTGVKVTPHGVKVTPTGVKSERTSNGQSLDVKQPFLGVDVQTSTETSTTPSAGARAYEIPSWKEQPTTCLVLSFKTLKGIAHDDRGWDKIHFGRNTASAKKLLEVCGNDFKLADRCLVAISTELTTKGFPWSFETVLRQAHEWLARERKTTNGPSYRQRLFDQLAQQRSAPGFTQAGADLHGNAVLNRFRNLRTVQTETRAANGSGHRRNDEGVGELREAVVEEAAD